MPNTVLSKKETTYYPTRKTTLIDTVVIEALENEGIIEAKTPCKVDYVLITDTYAPANTSLKAVKSTINRAIKQLKKNGKIVVIIPGDVDNNYIIDGVTYAVWITSLIKHINANEIRDVRYCVLKDAITPSGLENAIHPIEQIIAHQSYAPPEPYHKRSPMYVFDVKNKLIEAIFRASYANKVVSIGTNRNIKTSELQSLARECSIRTVQTSKISAKSWQSVFSLADHYLTVVPGRTTRQLLSEIAQESGGVPDHHLSPAPLDVPKASQAKTATNRSKIRRYSQALIGLITGLLFTSLLAPLVMLAVVSTLNTAQTQQARDNQHAMLGWAHRQNTRQIALIQRIVKPFGVSVNDLERFETLHYYQAKTVLHMHAALDYSSRGLSQILTLRAPDPRSTLREALSNIEQARVYQNQTVNLGANDGFESDIEPIERLASFAIALIDLHPDLNIAVLIQDDSELRATGGFLDAVALIDLKNRHLANINIQSSSELDRKLRGQVVPPSSLTRYLKDENWLLRDANWEADFQQVGPQVSRFLKEQTGVDHDLIIAITVSQLDKLVNDANTSAASRLKDIAQEYGSSADQERKDVYADSINKLLAQGKEGGSGVAHSLYGLMEAIRQKDLMIFTPYEDAIGAVSEASWSGGVVNPQCQALDQDKRCIADMMYVAETNIGVNKVNDSVKRSHLHEVELGQQSIGVSHVLEMQNQDQRDGWPGGDYKVLVRWYVPAQSTGVRLAIGDAALERSEYQLSLSGTHRIIEYASLVPAKTSQQIAIKYDLPIEAGHALENYTYIQQKQPGVSDASLDVKIVSASENGQEILRDETYILDQDQLISVEFDK